MIPTEKIDAALDSVLRAAGHNPACSHVYSLYAMREAMRKVMAASYIQGMRDAQAAIRPYSNTGNHPRIGRDKQ